MVEKDKWEYREKSISSDLSSTMLQSEILKYKENNKFNFLKIPDHIDMDDIYLKKQMSM